jgi:Tfp pilus assembly protein PilO
MTSIFHISDEFFFSFRYPRIRASLIFLSISLFTFLIVGIFYWWPEVHAQNKLAIQIEIKRRETFETDFNARLANISERTLQQVALIEKKLDASATQASLVRNFAVLASKCNVKITAETYEDGKPVDSYTPLLHTLSLQANYHDLRNFISDLQSLPTYTVIQDTVLGRSSGSNSIKAQISLITYRRTAGTAK